MNSGCALNCYLHFLSKDAAWAEGEKEEGEKTSNRSLQQLYKDKGGTGVERKRERMKEKEKLFCKR